MDDPNFPYCGGIRWLSVDDLIELNKRLIERYTPAEEAGVFNMGMLKSAHMRPAVWAYHTQDHDIASIAAIAIIALCTNHPFHNANKRTAFAAGRMLLFMNGYFFDPPHDEVIEVMIEIAKGEDAEFRDPRFLASWVADHVEIAPSEGLPLGTAHEYALENESGADS